MRLFKRAASGLFASESLIGHLVRGMVGIGLLGWAIRYQSQLALSAIAAIGALIAFRGCPVCWTIGLVETARAKWRAMQVAA